MPRVNGYGSGNTLDGYNKIQAKNDAKIKRNIRGFDTGIIDQSFYNNDEPRIANPDESLKLTGTTNQDIVIGRGMATCYGYDLVVDNLIQFDTINPPATGSKYVFVYLEWDLSNPDSNVFNVDLWDNGSGASWTPAEQDNLVNIPSGKFKLPIYRITIDTNGAISGIINLGVNVFYGVQDAQKARDWDTQEGNLKKKFEDLDKINLDVGTRLDKLGFKEGNVNLVGITSTGSIKRQGNYVYIYYEEDIVWSTTIKNQFFISMGKAVGIVGSNFAPLQDVSAALEIYDYFIGIGVSYEVIVDRYGYIITNRVNIKTIAELQPGERYKMRLKIGYEAKPL